MNFPALESVTKKAKSTVSLRDVARAAKVSVTAAGWALRNRPGVSEATRKRVFAIAAKLGYYPDPRLSSSMAEIRRTTFKGLLPVVWLNASEEKDAWHKYSFLSPYLEGARKRLLELGYRIEEVWLREPGHSVRRIAQIIESRGIEGVIVTDPVRHLRLSWPRLAGVAIGGGLLAPVLHRVAMDTNTNLSLALRSLKRLGFLRIGVSLTEQADQFSHHGARAMALLFNSTVPPSRRVEPLFTPNVMDPMADRKRFAAWLKKEKPDAVIGHSSQLVDWTEFAGFRVPDDISVVHTAIDDDVLDWAGIYANKRDIGRLAASKVVSLIQQREFGIPATASSELVPGVWRMGRTVRAKKGPQS
jgi:LacI family transcriptional regulator